MNVWNGIGNLTKDPKLMYSTGNPQMAVCKMTVAVNEYGENQKANFIPVTVFGRLAENCEKYLHKGSKVAVSGKITTDSYQKEGITYYTTQVIANNVEFLGGRNEEKA